MIVFKYYWKILLNQKVSIILFIGIFMGLILMFSASAGDGSDQFSSRSARIGVVDEDGSVLSQGLIGFLGEYHELSEIENNASEIEDALFFRTLEYVLIIPAGFGEQFINNFHEAELLNVRVPDSAVSFYIDNKIDSFLLTLRTYLNAGIILDTALSHTVSDLQEGIPVEVLPGGRADKASDIFQFLAYGLVSLMGVVLGAIFLGFNQKELRRRMDCSSMSIMRKNGQLALGCILGAIALWIVMLAIPFAIYRIDITDPIIGLRIVNSFMLLLVSVGIGFLLGNISKNAQILSAAISVIGMGLAFLTGVFIPVEFLGNEVLMVARFLPTYWYVQVNNMLTQAYSISQVSMMEFWEGALIQVGFALALFAVTLVIIRQKKLNAAD